MGENNYNLPLRLRRVPAKTGSLNSEYACEPESPQPVELDSSSSSMSEFSHPLDSVSECPSEPDLLLPSAPASEPVRDFKKNLVSPAKKTMTPSSELLKDAIRSKKAQKTSPVVDDVPPERDDLPTTEGISRSPYSSTLASHPKSLPKGAKSSIPVPRHMGFRETGEFVSKLHKENFDLKLEVFYRREAAAVLEAKIEKLAAELESLQALDKENEHLIFMNETLAESNEVLRSRAMEVEGELALQDGAVDEAAGIIAELEREVQRLRGDLD
ncbi:MAG: hypothetical protein M1829_003633 [Trizodia sp. TS-e1964]|nr:MAG: hypothetical protein M1829_003633 [Trizodia sp. TS-e1964]